jgi:hypothetical protein
MMTATIRIWLLAVCALALSAGIARANNPRWSDEELARFSNAIVTGRVTDVSTGRDVRTNAIYTYVTVLLDQVLKGDIAEREIVVKQLGGEIGNEGLGVADQAVFARGENVLLFLEARPRDRTLYTSGLWQGKWTIGRDGVSGEAIATRLNSGNDRRGVLNGESERRSLASFITRLRALGSADRATGDRGFVVLPPAEETRATVRAATAGGAPFTLFSPPWRWNQIDTNTAIVVDIMASGQPGLPGGGTTELANAHAVWANQTGLRFTAGGNTSRCFGGGSTDSHISIVFMDPCGEVSNAGGTLAIGGASYFTSSMRTVNGIAFALAAAGYIVNNDSSTALTFMTNNNCFQSVDTHELGHVLGLDHSLDSTAIMYASVSFSNCSPRPVPITQDDINGIRTIYGSGSATPTPTGVPGAPTSLVASSSGSSVTLTWSAPTGGGSPTAYIVEAGSAPSLSNLANFSTGNTATSFSAGGVGAGAYYVRVRATNSAGNSGSSNESLLSVGGGCTAPPVAPTGFALTGNSGGTVSFVWNASANATTYIIEAGSTPGTVNLANSNLGSSATTFTANGVGRGTYYVRLRAQNTCGTSSGVSNEVTLIVP